MFRSFVYLIYFCMIYKIKARFSLRSQSLSKYDFIYWWHWNYYRNAYIWIDFGQVSHQTMQSSILILLFILRVGRRKTFYITLCVAIFSSLSPTILRDLTSFIVFRVINGLILPSIYQIPYIICEYCNC
jgi:hypothetical protein